jgi:hypothetical protein
MYTRLDDESALVHHESLTELLRVPSLRSVCFYSSSFTSALCQATANALMEGTAITNLEFLACPFSVEASTAMMTKGLSRKTSVSQLKVVSSLDQALYSVLATALQSNSTLQELSINGSCLTPVLLALGSITGLRSLKVLCDWSVGRYGRYLTTERSRTSVSY